MTTFRIKNIEDTLYRIEQLLKSIDNKLKDIKMENRIQNNEVNIN